METCLFWMESDFLLNPARELPHSYVSLLILAECALTKARDQGWSVPAHMPTPSAARALVM